MPSSYSSFARNHGSMTTLATTAALVLVSAACGAAVATLYQKTKHSPTTTTTTNLTLKSDPEIDPAAGHSFVWNSIGGAMNAAMMYTGDRLGLYLSLRELCTQPGSTVTAVTLATDTGLNQRWLREWLAQQAGMGVLILSPGTGDTDDDLHYRLPAATAEVLANPDSPQYDISMIQTIPSLVNRAKTMLPEAFSSGIGRPYDEPEVADAIDRQHRVHIRDVFIPEVLIKVPGLVQQLEQGIQVADLGCGAANMLILLAKSFPNSSFHGYEISKVALQKGAYNIASSKCTNITLHDANEASENLGQHWNRYDLVVTFDVLHDSTHPLDLVQQVKAGLKSTTGVWLLADIVSAPTVRENLTQTPNPAIYYGFSTCLCMSCSLSVEGGTGLGTLGFSIPVANQMLREGGFEQVDVLLEKNNARWFLVK